MAGGPFLLTPEEQEEWQRGQQAPPEQQLDELRRNLNWNGQALVQPGGAMQPPPDRPRPGRRSTFSFSPGASNSMWNPFDMVRASTAQQGNHLANMASQVQAAIQDENDSRVAQEREQRRMEHEKELMRLQQEALLKRLQAEREMASMQLRAQREASDRANGILWSTDWNR